MLKNYFIDKEKISFINLVLLCVLIFVLPIAHTATIRSVAMFTPMLLLFGRYFIAKDFKWIKTSFELPFFAFFLMAIISIFTSVDRHETVKEIWGELIVPILLFYTTYYAIENKNHAFILLKALFIGSLVFSLYSFYDFYQHGGKFFTVVYKAGGLRDPGGGEVAALYHTMVIPFIFWALFYWENTKEKILLFFIFLINLVAFHITFVRAGMLALAFQTVFIIGILLREKKWILSIFLAIILIFTVHLYVEKKMLRELHNEKIPSIKDYIKMSPEEIAGTNPSSMKQRLAMWKTAIEKIAENPFYPHGYGRFLFGKTVRNEKNKHFIYPQTHNTFIGITFELGIQGLVVFLWIIGKFFFVCCKYWYKYKQSIVKYLSVSLITMMIGYWINNFFGSFDGDDSKLLFMMLLGIGMAIMHKTLKEKEFKC
ncbi:O-antigen ligase family protein [Thermodesulfovibrio sp. 3462-1]|uniref:O-antigen ligase family protein n=1 Tax=Thermodesulfovibrio obliviosus TaxID=3118332 RepID=A0AAU8H0A6_9BACT